MKNSQFAGIIGYLIGLQNLSLKLIKTCKFSNLFLQSVWPRKLKNGLKIAIKNAGTIPNRWKSNKNVFVFAWKNKENGLNFRQEMDQNWHFFVLLTKKIEMYVIDGYLWMKDRRTTIRKSNYKWPWLPFSLAKYGQSKGKSNISICGYIPPFPMHSTLGKTTESISCPFHKHLPHFRIWNFGKHKRFFCCNLGQWDMETK